MKNKFFKTEEEAKSFLSSILSLPPKKVWRHTADTSLFFEIEPTWPAGEGHEWSSETVNVRSSVEPYNGGFIILYNEEHEREVNIMLLRKAEQVLQEMGDRLEELPPPPAQIIYDPNPDAAAIEDLTYKYGGDLEIPNSETIE